MMPFKCIFAEMYSSEKIMLLKLLVYCINCTLKGRRLCEQWW